MNLASQLHREQEMSTTFPTMALLFNFNVVLGLGLFVLFGGKGMFGQGFLLLELLAFVSMVLMVNMIKYGLYKLAGLVFPFSKDQSLFIFHFFLIEKVLGLVLIPFVFVIAYATEGLSNAAQYIAVVLFIVAFLHLGWRGITIAKKRMSLYPYHFLLYICTLEIAPVVVLARLLGDF